MYTLNMLTLQYISTSTDYRVEVYFVVSNNNIDVRTCIFYTLTPYFVYLQTFTLSWKSMYQILFKLILFPKHYLQ